MNEIVFLTGGNKGIGRAILEKMVAQYSQVIFTYNTGVEASGLLTSTFKNCTAYQCDLLDKTRIDEIVKVLLNKYGGIDILIHNAGYENDAVFAKMNQNTWDDVIDVNLKSLYGLTHNLLPYMTERKWGRIVNITSIAALTGAYGKSNYAAAKAGIIGFTKSLSLELASKGITVNAIAPGAIETEMLFRIPQKYRDKILDSIPMKRFGKADEVADLVSFLVSDQAKYITGQCIHINGGSYLA